MKVAITGSHGLIGSALVQKLRWSGDEVVRLVRREPISPDERSFDPARGTIDGPGLADVDAVVNLAGVAIASGRWTAARKRAILDSRVATTRTLAAHFPADGHPRRFLSGSAIGFYGSRPDAVDEATGPGGGFLADVVAAWEAAAAEAPVPTVFLRTGHVMTPRGGYIGKQLLLFRAGLGGRMGPGTQKISWISLDDEVDAIRHLLRSEVTGPVNLTAPNPVDNVRFTTALGAAINRPTVLPVPMPALRLLFGNEMVDEAILSDQTVLPTRLSGDGYTFTDTVIEPALDRLLGE